MRLLRWTTTRIMDRYRCSCPINEQLLAGLVLLAQHHILFPSPPLIQLAEATVLVAVGIRLPVLFPKQLLRHVWMLLPLPVKIGEVGHREHRRAAARRTAEQRRLKSVIVPLGSEGIDLKLFGFIPEPVFTFVPESRSGSSGNTVRHHPGIEFILPRIPQPAI